MKPTLAAEELRKNLTQYLSTTFALADPPVRDALDKFLNHPQNGIFRGPYLRIRTPFREVTGDWRQNAGLGTRGTHAVPAPDPSLAAAVQPGPHARADADHDRHRVR